jgi:transposase-like protein
MAISYSPAFKEQALVKAHARGNRSIESIADELQMNKFTLKNWLDEARHKMKLPLMQEDKRPQDWTAQERLLAVIQAHDLSPTQLQVFCREKGLFAHHLTSWRAHFCSADKAALEQVQIRQLKEQNRLLNQSLARKEKALAEAAALLILQKKFQALWEEGEK